MMDDDFRDEDAFRTPCMDCIHDPEYCGHLNPLMVMTECDFFEDIDDDLEEEDFEDDDLEEDDEDLEDEIDFEDDVL